MDILCQRKVGGINQVCVWVDGAQITRSVLWGKLEGMRHQEEGRGVDLEVMILGLGSVACTPAQ